MVPRPEIDSSPDVPTLEMATEVPLPPPVLSPPSNQHSGWATPASQESGKSSGQQGMRSALARVITEPWAFLRRVERTPLKPARDDTVSSDEEDVVDIRGGRTAADLAKLRGEIEIGVVDAKSGASTDDGEQSLSSDDEDLEAQGGARMGWQEPEATSPELKAGRYSSKQQAMKAKHRAALSRNQRKPCTAHRLLRTGMKGGYAPE
eukprot:gnl/TRDRNA2_/TRDRNA2_41896_c0_seq1.p1 gnl/TRDRNA2_/TRDRNA2_41896_c0~~gnl/TRDRNA2_/TRDRNA2_41896_c0_seq1.p1  ORF type:complete len:206 (+),score=34.17 gnl/TRDRNA2_/TRDRNA2_41896_c0_seq1:60-677(+)